MAGVNGIVRMGKRITLREQLRIRKLPNTEANQKIFDEYRGRPLALRVLTPEEHILRAETVIEALANASDPGGAVKALEEKMAEVDALFRSPETQPLIDLIELPADQIITIPAGTYTGLGRGKSIPEHEATLERDHFLFPLTIGFLKQFSAVNLVASVLGGIYSERKPDDELAGGVNINLALKLGELINTSLVGNVRLRVPAEPLMSVFFANDEFEGALGRNFHLLTASKYDAKVVDTQNIEIELALETINKTDEFVYRHGYTDPQDGIYKIGRHFVHSDATLNTGVLYEVVAA